MPYRSLIASIIAIALMSSPLAAKTDEKDKAKQLCIDYQNELVALETPALRERLQQDPSKVATELSEAEIANIKRLIKLDELLMFGCRIGLKAPAFAQNALQRAVAIPTLPVRKPKIARRSITPRTIVPLPTRRSDAK